MEAIHDLDILRAGSLGKGKGKEIRKTEQLRVGMAVMVNYLVSSLVPRAYLESIDTPARDDWVRA